jgi:hypothetical protein
MSKPICSRKSLPPVVPFSAGSSLSQTVGIVDL